MRYKCLECHRIKNKSELKKYGGICDSCSEQMVDGNDRTRQSSGKCVATIVEGDLGGLKLEK